MESTDKPAPEPQKAAPPPEAPAPVPEKAEPPPESKVPDCFVVADVVLRVILFAAAVTAVVVMVTGDQKKHGPFTRVAVPVPVPEKFNYSPAFIYFVAALSVAGLHSIVTTVISILALFKPGCSTKLLPHFVIFDVLILGIVAAATGAAGAVAYIGLKGNSHFGWAKICNNYHKFCQHLAASVAVSLVAAIVLVLLIILSAFSLSKKIPPRRDSDIKK
ncbi:CASP-like protein 1 [Camellia sinensis]|uniref:CASP-like protein 1 n=1 Tax=Camellia sinensis TaxID=4442 RepID=UPI001035A16F|nr:CASP-like protein 1 [Camellia sinensis]